MENTRYPIFSDKNSNCVDFRFMVSNTDVHCVQQWNHNLQTEERCVLWGLMRVCHWDRSRSQIKLIHCWSVSCCSQMVWRVWGLWKMAVICILVPLVLLVSHPKWWMYSSTVKLCVDPERPVFLSGSEHGLFLFSFSLFFSSFPEKMNQTQLRSTSVVQRSAQRKRIGLADPEINHDIHWVTADATGGFSCQKRRGRL